MREILFRGKTVRGDWVTGLLAHIGNAWYISNKAGIATAYEVIPSTVGQYTGLTDKNGQKIFEGDIVQIITANIDEEELPFVVDWDTDMAAFSFSNDTLLLTFDNFYQHQVEVIGNIHDNPELLGEVVSSEH